MDFQNIMIFGHLFIFLKVGQIDNWERKWDRLDEKKVREKMTTYPSHSSRFDTRSQFGDLYKYTQVDFFAPSPLETPQESTLILPFWSVIGKVQLLETPFWY